jgi:hypothetical protein
MVSIRRHIVPNPATMHSTHPRAMRCVPRFFLHTRYDALGRLETDMVPSAVVNVDDTVTTREYKYDTLGNLVLATSEGSNGSVVNQVKRVYNGFGQLAVEYQEHNGPVSGSSKKVQYGYVFANNFCRLATVTYPDGSGVNYGYDEGSTNTIGRVTSISQNSQALETYSYLGTGTVIGSVLPQPGIARSIQLDHFGRIGEIRWTESGALLAGFDYGYSPDGNVLYRDDLAADDSLKLDEAYTYTKRDQQKSYARGVLNAAHQMTVTDSYLEWRVDSQGNRYDGKYGSDYNAQNQCTASSAYADMGYPTNVLFTATKGVGLRYDSWNDVAETSSSATNRYQYDALGRRIASTQEKHPELASDIYYDGVRPLEEYDSNGLVLSYNIWSPADGRLILRDADPAKLFQYHNGSEIPNIPTGSPRLYSMTDAAGSVVAVANSSGDVQERYLYDADGMPQALKDDWSPYHNGHGGGDPGVSKYSLHAWDWLYHGQRFQVARYELQPNDGEVRGLYEGLGGQWYDPQHGCLIQPVMSGNGENPYGGATLTTRERLSIGYVKAGPIVLATGVALSTWWLGGGVVAIGVAGGFSGGVAAGAGNSALAGNSNSQMAVDAAIYGTAGGVGGAVGGGVFNCLGPTLVGFTASGAAGLGIDWGITSFYQGYQSTHTIAGAAYSGARGFGTGALVGGAFGGVSYGVLRGLGAIPAPGTAPSGVVARFRGDPFAFGTGARSARVQAIVDEATRASGISDLSTLVDDVVYDPAGSYFTVINGRRVLSVGDSAFGRTGVGQLMEAGHEIVHAQQFDRFMARGGYATIDDAADAFFNNVSDQVYARQERVAEYLSRLRINQHVGGMSPEQWGASTRYINGWR